MNIRIRDNSIRPRLTKGEVDAIRNNGVVESTTGFPGGRQFSYSLEIPVPTMTCDERQ